MADIIATATRGITPTVSEAGAFIHVRTRSIMESMVTNAQRITVSPYRVDRGAFLPKYPLFSVLTKFYGVISSQTDTSWNDLVSTGYILWDAAAASSTWISLPSGAYGQLTGDAAADVIIEHQMHGDRTSSRFYAVAAVPPSWGFNALIEQSTQTWIVLAFRVLAGERNGPILSMGIGTQVVSVWSVGDVFDMRIDDVSFGTQKKASKDTRVTVLGLAIDNDTVIVRIRDGERTNTYTWVTGLHLVGNQMILGGPSSPECLLYATAQGDGTNMPDVMTSIVGYLSC